MIEVKCCKHDILMKWFVVRICNFNCPFCIEGASNVRKFDKELIQEATEQAYQTSKKILKYIRKFKNKDIKLTLTGGECSLVDLNYVFQDFNDIGEGNTLRIVMITNFSAPNKKYREFFSMLDSFGITHSMTVSLHDNHWKNFDYITNKILDVKDLIGCINYVITNENKDLIIKYFDYLREHGMHKQRIGVNRNTRVDYLVDDDIWDIIKSRPTAHQMRWTEDGITEKLDMDVMINERLTEHGYLGWKCYPCLKINPDGTGFICKHIPIDLAKDEVPEYIICQKNGKCTPYNWTKVVSE